MVEPQKSAVTMLSFKDKLHLATAAKTSNKHHPREIPLNS